MQLATCRRGQRIGNVPRTYRGVHRQRRVLFLSCLHVGNLKWLMIELMCDVEVKKGIEGNGLRNIHKKAARVMPNDGDKVTADFKNPNVMYRGMLVPNTCKRHRVRGSRGQAASRMGLKCRGVFCVYRFVAVYRFLAFAYKNQAPCQRMSNNNENAKIKNEVRL